MLILLVVTIIINFLLLILKKEHLNKGFFISTVILSIVAFNFDPIKALNNGNYTDLIRFYDVMDKCRTLGWTYISNHPDYSSLFLARLYVYFCSLFKWNQILATMTCFICYSLVFYVIYKFGMKENCKKNILILVSIFFLITINFKVIIANIRAPIVFCVFFYLIYIELIEKKYKLLCWIGYILLCFMHQVAIFIIIIRIFVIIYNKYYGNFIKILLVSWSLLSNQAILILYKFTYIPYFSGIIDKVKLYSNPLNQIYDPNLIIITWIKNIVFIIILIYFKKNIKKEVANKYKDLYTFTILLICFDIGSFKSIEMFTRISDLITYLMLIVIILCLGNVRANLNFNIEKKSGYKRENVFLYGNLIKIALVGLMMIYFIYYFAGYQYNVLCY